MPQGFTGGLAHKYLLAVHSALSTAISSHNSNRRDAPACPSNALLRALPHTPDEATSGGATGGTPISAHRAIYTSASFAITNNAETYTRMIYALGTRMEELSSTEFILPQTNAAILPLIGQMKQSQEELLELFHQFASGIRMFSGEIVDTNGGLDGHQVNLAWVVGTAESIRSRSEAVMNAQSNSIRNTINHHYETLMRIEEDAIAFEHTAVTAMHTIWYEHWFENESGQWEWEQRSRQEEDTATRASAAESAREIRQRMVAIRQSITNLNTAREALQRAILDSNNTFHQSQDLLQDIDHQHANRLRDQLADLDVFIRKMQILRENITPLFNTNPEYLAQHLRAIQPFGQNGFEINWDRVAQLLDRPVDRINDDEWTALYTLLASLDNAEDITRFMRALADKEEDIDLTGTLRAFNQQHLQYSTWSFCPDKVERLQGGLAQKIAEVNERQRDEIPRTAAFNDIDAERRALIQRYEILGLMLFFCQYETSSFNSSGGTRTTISGPLTGAFGANGPSLSLRSDGDNGFYLHFTKNTRTVHTTANHPGAINTTNNVFGGFQFHISETFDPINSQNQVNIQLRDDVQYKYGISTAMFFANGIWKKVIDKLDPSSFITGIAGLVSDYGTHRQNAANANAQVNRSDLALAAQTIGLNVTFINDSNGNIYHFVVSPSHTTQAALDALENLTGIQKDINDVINDISGFIDFLNEQNSTALFTELANAANGW